MSEFSEKILSVSLFIKFEILFNNQQFDLFKSIMVTFTE